MAHFPYSHIPLARLQWMPTSSWAEAGKCSLLVSVCSRRRNWILGTVFASI